MKKDWLCRGSYDEKNQEIAPVMMTQWWSRLSDDDLDPVMMIRQWWSRSSDDVQWWSRSSDDVQWWSRSSNDPDLVMMSSDDPNLVMIHIRWLEDEEDLKMTRTRWWSRRYREEDLCWKLCQKNTFLVKRECWCICNFRMYFTCIYYIL